MTASEGAAPWWQGRDPHNPENTSAGNGADLVKHTVYAVLLSFLLERRPWREGMRLRECHAGRGVYRIPASDPRRDALEALHRGRAEQLILLKVQQAALRRLGVEPGAQLDWYVGSACANALRLGDRDGHSYEGYEWAPETRAILAAALEAMDLGQLPVSLPGALPGGGQPGLRFEGERHVAEQLPGWGPRDVILLDPFGLWRRPKLAPRRARYRRLLDAWIARGEAAPPLSWYFTWSHEETANSEIQGQADAVSDGYQALLQRLRDAGRAPLQVRWRWEQTCAMWLLVTDELRQPLTERLDAALGALAEQMTRCGSRGPDRLVVGG